MKKNETGRCWPTMIAEELISPFRSRPDLDLGSLKSEFVGGLVFPLGRGRVARVRPKAACLDVALLSLEELSSQSAPPAWPAVRAWRRFSRSRPVQCLAVGDDRFCLLLGDRIMAFSDEGEPHPVDVSWHEMPTAPLVAATDGNGRLFVGDYTGMGSVGKPRVYVSSDFGRSWQSLTDLQGVRHIHGLHWGTDGSLWITTGDDDRESGIWRWTARKGLSVVARGSQLDRVVQVVPHAGGLLYGTDAPKLRENHIYLADPFTGRRARLSVCDAPVYFAASSGDTAVLTTAAEPTSAGLTTGCRVLVLRGREVIDQLVVPTDRLPIRAFGYGVIRCDAFEEDRFLLRHHGTIFDGRTQVLDARRFEGRR